MEIASQPTSLLLPSVQERHLTATKPVEPEIPVLPQRDGKEDRDGQRQQDDHLAGYEWRTADQDR